MTKRITRITAATALALAVATTAAACSGNGADEAGSEAPTTTMQQTTPPSPTVPQIGQQAADVSTAYAPLDTKVFDQWDAMAGHGGQSDPDWVFKAGLAESFAWQPATDTSQFDAIQRASSIWNRQYIKDNEMKLSTIVPMSLRDWTTWGDQGVAFFPVVHVLNDQHPPDTATDISRVVKIDMRTGKPGAARDQDAEKFSIIAYVRLHNAANSGDDQWRIDNINVTDVLTGGQQ